jgi:hypothetical protein
MERRVVNPGAQDPSHNLCGRPGRECLKIRLMRQLAAPKAKLALFASVYTTLAS